jgi:rubrerythrin
VLLTIACGQNRSATEYVEPVASVAEDRVVSKSVTTASLDDRTRQALFDALADERKAESFYRAVLEKFGDARPFSNIVNAERRHEGELLPLFEKYGVPVPENSLRNAEIEVPSTLIDACRKGIDGEKANIEMYDGFLGFVKEIDVREVFTYLRDASMNNHLPAFERCAEGRGPGNGRGRNFGGS